jgi:signal transduction histidine kinase
MFRTSRISKDELQQIAAEVYKKNAELAVKNKTFSLLEKLYKASAAGLDLGPLSEELTTVIAEALDLPFVVICTKDGKDILVRGVSGKKKILRQLALVLPERFVLSSSPVLQSAFRNKQKKHTAVLQKAIGFLPHVNRTQLKTVVVESVCLPLISGSRVIGGLVLCLPKPYAEFTRFEQQAIHNVTQVVSIAIDRSTVYEHLKKANDRLKELDKLKTEFLSIATHQLRTPLSIIKGYTSLLDEGAYGKVSKKQKEILHNIDVSNERLISLVDEFLDVSRIEQGRTQYQFEEMDLSEVVQSVLAELAQKAQTKSITIQPLLLVSALMVGDASRIRHGVFNFFDNAIKYSPNNTTITIYLEKQTGGFAYRVIDEGAGLDASDLTNLFQKFYRSPNVSRDFDGNGLGIYVVKEFIDAHGGHVWAKSEGIGKGSEFGFFVPARPKKIRG